MTTLEELQAEVARKDKAVHDLAVDNQYMREDIQKQQELARFWQNQAEVLETRLAKVLEETQNHSILVHRLEAERNALWEVIKLQRGGPHAAEERSPDHGHDPGGVPPSTSVPDNGPGEV